MLLIFQVSRLVLPLVQQHDPHTHTHTLHVCPQDKKGSVHLSELTLTSLSSLTDSNLFTAKKLSWSQLDSWLCSHRAPQPIPSVWILILEWLLSRSGSDARLIGMRCRFKPPMQSRSDVHGILDDMKRNPAPADGEMTSLTPKCDTVAVLLVKHGNYAA